MISSPTYSLLIKYLPIEIWKVAEKQASRSVFRLFKTGAVITDGRNILSKGCSHARDVPVRNMHAEQHSLMNVYDASGLTCVIVTLNKSNNWSYSSKPCARCSHLLNRAGVETVIYAERDNVGEWTINMEKVVDLVKRTNPISIHAPYA